MARFAPTKYNPALDSSEGYEKFAERSNLLVLSTNLRDTGDGGPERIGCPCGCGAVPVGKTAVFMMGHDARLRGKLIRAHLTGTEVVRYVDGEQANPVSALEDAKRWGESFTTALKNAELRREGANRNLVTKALNSQRLIKVGRWEHTGQVVAVYETDSGEEYDVEYVTKSGETRKVRVPADKAKEVAE
jgi:hypothetical protein